MGGTTIPNSTDPATDRVKDRLARTVAGLRARPDLNARGLEIRIGAAKHHALVELREMRAAKDQRRTSRIQELEARFYRLPGDNPSATALYRASLAQAAEFRTAADAAQAMSHAEFTGDTIAARAIAFEARNRSGGLQQGWRPIIERFAATIPNGPETLAELTNLTSGGHPVGDRMADDINYGVGDLAEVRGATDFKLQQLAAIAERLDAAESAAEPDPVRWHPTPAGG